MFAPRPVKSFLTALLIIDLIAIGFHIIVLWLSLNSGGKLVEILYGHFAITLEGALPEAFNYGKWVIATVLSLTAFVYSRRAFFLGMMAASGFLFVDDAAQVHEKVGEFLIDANLPDPFGLGGVAVGEIVGFGGLGVAVFLSLFFAWRMGTQDQRRHLTRIVAAIFGMFLCGVIADATHVYLVGKLGNTFIGHFTEVIEDGGEMVFISLYTAVVFSLFYRSL